MIVVVDAASTDATGELVAFMADGHVRYVRHEAAIGPNIDSHARAWRGPAPLQRHGTR